MFEIARMDYTQYRKHFFPKQQDGWDILSCCFASPLPPQRCPARLFIDDNCRPRSAAVVMGDFVFLSGEPKLSFLKEVAGRDGLLLIARNEGWQEQLPALAGESFADYKCYPRYRFSLAAKEDQLQQILSSLPEGMRWSGSTKAGLSTAARLRGCGTSALSLPAGRTMRGGAAGFF